ncbi:MAG: hypothetical protein AABM66_02070 [Actinomycetota bacterium]
MADAISRIPQDDPNLAERIEVLLLRLSDDERAAVIIELCRRDDPDHPISRMSVEEFHEDLDSRISLALYMDMHGIGEDN